MAQVHISIYATLRKYIDGKPSVDVDIQPGQTVQEVLAGLNIPADEVRILFVDHAHASLEQSLQGGEKLRVFPAIGGG